MCLYTACTSSSIWPPLKRRRERYRRFECSVQMAGEEQWLIGAAADVFLGTDIQTYRMSAHLLKDRGAFP